MGQIYGSDRIRIDGDRIKSFAAEFDPQPFHLDEHAARDSIFRGLAASGWHTRRSPCGSWSRASSSPLATLSAPASTNSAGRTRCARETSCGGRERDHRRASIEFAPGTGAHEGTGDHVQSGRQGCASTGSEHDCTTPPDAACRRSRCLMSPHLQLYLDRAFAIGCDSELISCSHSPPGRQLALSERREEDAL